MDERRALALFRQACDAGNGDGCYFVGRAYDKGLLGLAKDGATAITFFDRACKWRATFACFVLGARYREGRGVTTDKGRAASLLKAACDGDEAAACLLLGYMLETGDGVSKNQADATALFKKACDLKDGDACIKLAERFQREVPRDDIHAVAALRQSCDGGSATACVALAGRLLSGPAGVKDVPLGIALLERTCDRQDLDGSVACFFLGARYLTGDEVAKDERRARELFKQACRHPKSKGCGAVREMQGRIGDKVVTPAGS